MKENVYIFKRGGTEKKKEKKQHGVGMLVTLVKAMGASNKWINSAEQGQFICFVQESDCHHHLILLRVRNSLIS